MRLTVHLHTILQRQTPAGLIKQLELEAPAGSRFDDLLRILEIPLPVSALILVQNGRVVDEHAELQEGDVLHLMPALSGGCPLYG